MNNQKLSKLGTRHRPWVALWIGLVGLTVGLSQNPEYVLTVTQEGEPGATASAGETFTLDIGIDSLNGVEGAGHNASLFYLQFSEPGLIIDSFEWQAPYVNGTLDDDSIPGSSLLPVTVLDSTLVRGGAGAGTADAQFSNVTSSGVFTIGTLLKISFRAPEAGMAESAIGISASPDGFTLGFQEQQVVAGEPFTLNVVTAIPEPSTYALLAFGAMCLLSRRRRRSRY
jgi:hypothetical protein